jgi:pimeloyl-ACP methyl ester carboxylesterase
LAKKPPATNAVYQRYALKWADFPEPPTPSAHSDEAELFCARQAYAAYWLPANAPFEPNQDYIPARSREAMVAQAIAVGDLIEGEASVSFEGERGYRTVVTDQASALLLWKERRLIIAFRGTANWQDWIHNFTQTTISLAGNIGSFRPYEFHKGFYGLAANLFPPVVELIGEFVRVRGGDGRDVQITLCGHSLGGALALNFAGLWEDHLAHDWTWRPVSHWGFEPAKAPKLGAIYTFGSPCLGKGEIWQAIVRPHYRLIVRDDPVPKTPYGFTEDFQAAFLEKPGRSAKQPIGLAAILTRAAGAMIRSAGFDAKAHDIEGYIEAIEAKILAKTADTPLDLPDSEPQREPQPDPVASLKTGARRVPKPNGRYRLK